MKKLLPLGIAIALLISACNDDQSNEDQSKTVDKNGSVEVSLSTKHLDSLKDLLTTHYTIWRKGVMVKQYDKTDTLPSLGKMLPENDDNNSNNSFAQLIPRDYEFFVTIK